MKVSLNWIKEYTNVDLPIEELVDKIGKQLGAVEEVIDVGKKYQGIVIAKVMSCEKHPDADRLKVCLIDDGGKIQNIERNENGYVQVVCGAPNVEPGMLVAWLPPGVTVPSTFDTDPFVLEARQIRGVVSNGMLASGKELGINDDHSGILTLENNDSLIGKDFAEQYDLNDYVIDIENKMFTHRPDCFGILGVAREIAGITGRPFQSSADYKEDKTTGTHPDDESLLDVEVQSPELVPRFMVQVVKNVQAKPSPLPLQIKLMKVGLRPINYLVDITNYMMYLTAQPMHAYDYDKLVERAKGGKPKIIVRQPEDGEELTLLNGKTIKLQRENTILIADTAGPIGLGGIMGGADTEVDENTKNIVLEAANFDMYTIRKASMHYGLFTDAVSRFNKGQSPWQNDKAMAMAVGNIVHDLGAQPARSIYDIETELKKNPEVTLSQQFIQDRLGIELPVNEIERLLTNVEFKVEVNGGELKVTAPFWRTDIEIPEDIVEEVGRLYGYDKMPLDLPRRTVTPVKPEPLLQFKQTVRNKLAALGANEVLTYSFVHGDLLDKTGQNKDLAFKLSNALSPNLQYYRMSLMPSLLNNVHANIKSGYDRFALFEIGKSHNKMHQNDDGGVPKEYEMVAMVFADNHKKGAAYYDARAFLDSLARSFNFEIEYRPLEKDADYPVVKPFEPSRSALAFAKGTDVALGIVGEFRPTVRKSLKLPQATAGFEIGTHELMAATSGAVKYKPLSKYPSVTQDICLQIPESVSYGALSAEFEQSLKNHHAADQSYDTYPIDIYTSEQIKGQKRITYRVILTSSTHTLTDDVLSSLLEKVAADMNSKFSATRI